MGLLYQRLCPSWCFFNNLHWDKSGRIIIGWNPLFVQVNIKTCSSQLMHLEVTPVLGSGFHCTFLYAATDKKLRVNLFSMLDLIAKNISGPWTVAYLQGDFNCVVNLNERLGHVVRLSEVRTFRTCMDTCVLHDMKSNGRFFTWNNEQSEENRVFSMIDCTLCNDLWEDEYPTVEVSLLLEGDHFDHSPMLIQFFSHHTSKKPFRFFNFWTNNHNFNDVVSKVWTTVIPGHKSFQIQEKLKMLKPTLKKYFQHTPI